MSDWRDQFSEPRCGYCQIVDIAKNGKLKIVEHRYLTDFGFVLLDGPSESDKVAFDAFKSKVMSDSFRKKVKEFAQEKWETGENSPFKWTGDL